MNGFIVVFLGGGLGSAARHAINLLATQHVSSRYPLGTFAINVAGSLAIGVLAEWFALRAQLPAETRLFFITGILGGFTTFSAFSLEIGLMFERGEIVPAILYALGSVIFGVAALFLGMFLVRELSR